MKDVLNDKIVKKMEDSFLGKQKNCFVKFVRFAIIPGKFSPWNTLS